MRTTLLIYISERKKRKKGEEGGKEPRQESLRMSPCVDGDLGIPRAAAPP